MIEFTPWSKPGIQPRLYVTPNTDGNAYLYLLKTGEPRIQSNVPLERRKLTELLQQGGLMNQAYPDFEKFLSALEAYGYTIHRTGTSAARKTFAGTKPQKSDYANMATQAQLHREALALDPSSIKFNRSKRPYIITVDTREPSTVASILAGSGIEVHQQALAVGDIRITSTETQDELIIERKTVSDLYNSIVSHHAHRQAESIFEYQASLAEQGVLVQVYWLIEGEENGSRMLYNAFPKIVQTDGVVNYFSAILGQFVLQTFNTNHTAYMAVKLAQGFFERELVFKVNEKERKSRTPQASRSALLVTADQQTYHGVRGDKNPLMQVLMAVPSLKEPVAKQIIARRHRFADVLRFTETQWLEFEGVGKLTAQKILKELEQI